jgi:hypothetical protein
MMWRGALTDGDRERTMARRDNVAKSAARDEATILAQLYLTRSKPTSILQSNGVKRVQRVRGISKCTML